MADRPADPATPESPPVITEPNPALDPEASVTETPSDEAADTPATAERRSAWRELPALVIAALVLAILIKSFLIQAFFIPSPSMMPALQHGDRILVCRVCLRFGDIHRGDILVFSEPHPVPGDDRGVVGGVLHWLGEGIGVAQPQDDDFIKRVAALPGQTWEIRRGDLYVDGERIDRPFLSPNVDTRSFGPQTVPDGMLFTLGDNPLESGDSRFPPNEGGLGYVPVSTVIGKAFVIIWPPSRMGRLR